MARKNAPKHKFEKLFVNPGRIADAVQSEEEHIIPIRQIKVLFPIYKVEAFGEMEEEHEYELLEHFIERGIFECDLTSAAALNTFFGLNDMEIVEKMLAFLRAIDHIEGPDDQLILTELGKKSLEMAKRCRILKTQRIFYFDAFTLSPLRRDYHDLRFLSANDAWELRDPNIFRLNHLTSGQPWQDAKMYELAENKDRVKYNLPRGITITDVQERGVVYLPMSLIELRKYDGANNQEETSYVAITGIRGFKDDDFTRIVNEDEFTQIALHGSTENQVKNVRETLKEWLKGQPFAPFATISQNEKKVWRLHLDREVFKQPDLRGVIKIRDIGNYRLANSYFLQYWCEDQQARYDAALEQITSTLDHQRRQGVLKAAIVERTFESARQRLQLDWISWESFQNYALAHKKEELLELLEEIMVGSPLLTPPVPSQSLEVPVDVEVGLSEQSDDNTENISTQAIIPMPEVVRMQQEVTPGSSLQTVDAQTGQNSRPLAASLKPDDAIHTIKGAMDAIIPGRSTPEQATWSAYGHITTDARRYRPLDTVTVHIHGRRQGDQQALIRVCDSNQKTYYEAQVTLQDNLGAMQFKAAGALGAHYIYLFWPQEEHYSRYLNFLVECETDIESGDADFDCIYPLSQELMLLGRREYQFPDGKFVGYISADARHFDGIQLRDWLYGLPAYKYWERDMTCGLDHFLNMQDDDGMIPGGIERSGKTWQVEDEAEAGYILILGVWQTWLTTGDQKWLQQTLPRLEKVLNSIQNNPCRWDTQHHLVKRQHSCDTRKDDSDSVELNCKEHSVIATCDQSGYYQAFLAMSQMYRSLDNAERATYWAEQAEAYRQRAVALLWDGQKFLHHVHLSPINHGNFDETQQLAMGNAWAITRGLANREQAQLIIEEYRRRHATTGDAYPWWSLQPGYPDEPDYLAHPSRQQGGYANGGLMPWVGGELCLGAFHNDLAHYGVELLRQYSEHLRRTGGVYTWYWPDGATGFRTSNEIPYTAWGLAQWVQALIEGLAGINDQSGYRHKVTVSPRWTLTDVHDVSVYAHYACNHNYIAYHMQIDYSTATLNLDFSGSGQQATFYILLPHSWQPTKVALNDQLITYEYRHSEDGLYVSFDAPIHGISTITIVGSEQPSDSFKENIVIAGITSS